MTTTSSKAFRNAAPPGSAGPARTASPYSRFIPREELGAFAAWHPDTLNAELEPAAAAAPPAEAAAPPAQVAAARQAGYQDGYRDGLVALESFKESHARQLSGQIGLLVRAFDTELSALEQQLAGSVARVATELARQVVRSELAIRPALVAQVAQEAMAAVLQSARHITVQVHPDDHALVAQGCEEALGARGARLQAHAGVARGGCRVESDAGTIDACVAARWAQATQALGTGLGWSDHDAPGADA